MIKGPVSIIISNPDRAAYVYRDGIEMLGGRRSTQFLD